MAATAPPSRPDLYVVARLLDRLWHADGPMLKTHLQVGANVNYDVFSRYLAWLVERGFVSFEDNPNGHERVALTSAGREAYGTLVRWIHEFVHRRTDR